MNGWKDAEPSVRYDCPLSIEMGAFSSFPIGQNLSGHLEDRTDIPFLRVSFSPSQGTVKGWALELSFRSRVHVARFQGNLLAVVEQGIGWVFLSRGMMVPKNRHKIDPFTRWCSQIQIPTYSSLLCPRTRSYFLSPALSSLSEQAFLRRKMLSPPFVTSYRRDVCSAMSSSPVRPSGCPPGSFP